MLSLLYLPRFASAIYASLIHAFLEFLPTFFASVHKVVPSFICILLLHSSDARFCLWIPAVRGVTTSHDLHQALGRFLVFVVATVYEYRANMDGLCFVCCLFAFQIEPERVMASNASSAASATAAAPAAAAPRTPSAAKSSKKRSAAAAAAASMDHNENMMRMAIALSTQDPDRHLDAELRRAFFKEMEACDDSYPEAVEAMLYNHSAFPRALLPYVPSNERRIQLEAVAVDSTPT